VIRSIHINFVVLIDYMSFTYLGDLILKHVMFVKTLMKGSHNILVNVKVMKNAGKPNC
jgi:hypothetical protein